MSQQDNFIGGFLAGTVVGGVVGGILGVLIASKLTNAESSTTSEPFSKLEGKPNRGRRGQLKAPTEQSIETARRGLEDKIAQLNDAIDDVRQQLGGVNGTPRDETEGAIAREP
jgi:gas vesicle protein